MIYIISNRIHSLCCYLGIKFLSYVADQVAINRECFRRIARCEVNPSLFNALKIYYFFEERIPGLHFEDVFSFVPDQVSSDERN